MLFVFIPGKIARGGKIFREDHGTGLLVVGNVCVEEHVTKIL